MLTRDAQIRKQKGTVFARARHGVGQQQLWVWLRSALYGENNVFAVGIFQSWSHEGIERPLA